MKDFKNNLKEVRDNIDALKNELLTAPREKFKKMADEQLFNKYDELKNFSWAQYTPYFNDGEDCEFKVNLYSLAINGFNEDNYDEDEDEVFGVIEGVNIMMMAQKNIWSYSESKRIENPDYDVKYSKIVNDVTNFISSFDEDDLKFLFGDHVEIRLTNEKITIDKYDHE